MRPSGNVVGMSFRECTIKSERRLASPTSRSFVKSPGVAPASTASGLSSTLSPCANLLSMENVYLGNLFSNVYKGEIQGQSLAIDIDVFTEATVKQQVVHPSSLLKQTIYWEGKSTVSGSHKGKAYVELVGYE